MTGLVTTLVIDYTYIIKIHLNKKKYPFGPTGEIISHFLGSYGHKYMKIGPDRLADSCKHSSVNWMATDSRLPRSI